MLVSSNILALAHTVIFRVLATTRSHFVTSKLCRHVCYINFLLHMLLSMINKLMLVVTIRRGLFMNSVFVNPGIY